MLVLSASLLPSVAHAQSADDVVVMRRSVAPPRLENAPSARKGVWTPGTWRYVDQAPACSDAADAVRDVDCMLDGRKVAERYCLGTPQGTDGKQPRYDGCTIDWAVTDYGQWSSTCSTNASRTFTSACMRTGGSATPALQPETACTGTKPVRESGKTVLSGCTYRWEGASEADWSPWSSMCSQNATRTRLVRCERSDSTPAAETLCTDPKPAEQETKPQTSGCHVYEGIWSNGSVFEEWSACTNGKTTRSTIVQCKIGSSIVTDDRCDPSTKPQSTTETKTCTHTCAALTDQRKIPYDSGTQVIIKTLPAGTSVSSGLQQAQEACNAQIVNGAYPYRYCYVSYYPGAGAAMTIFFRYANVPAKISTEGGGYTGLSSCTPG